MRRIILFSVVLFVEAGVVPAWADIRASIAGAAPILPAMFTPQKTHLEELPPPAEGPRAAARDKTTSKPAEASIETPPPPRRGPAALEKPAAIARTADDPIKVPATAPMPAANPPPLLFDRHLGKAEKEADLSGDLIEAILRIESFYDPTRVDPLGEPPPMEVRAGTAAMNNVFADRWRLDDTDPNVHIRVRYLAQAWMRSADTGCEAFFKQRASLGGFTLSALSTEDCARMRHLRDNGDTQWTPPALTRAPLSVPVFAAPLPGSRMSSSDFWAAQRARIAAINARLKHKWDVTAAGSTR